MPLPANKTKIVCTIGPASRSPGILEAMIDAGMNVARLNLSHGGPEQWAATIDAVRRAAAKKERIIEIFVDLPGAKIRIGTIENGPLMLKKGEHVTLSPDAPAGSRDHIPVEYPRLAESVKPGGKIYLNDGFIELKVREVKGNEVQCEVVVGGPLTSHKGMNLPGAKYHVEPVTARDLELVDFALDHGIETIGISFVTGAEDVRTIKDHAGKRGKQIFAIAKIELGAAVEVFDEILNAADAIMIARGDLGVEMPIAEVPLIQKKLISKANLMGRPVITATQMLESMKNNTRPTRAEVSDVANAILDGTDAVMLSEETAMGSYPVETVAMMASIAASAETGRRTRAYGSDELRGYLRTLSEKGQLTVPDVISRNSVVAAEVLNARYIITPTDTGGTPRRVSRYKPGSWILAFSSVERTCRRLAFSYGVYSFVVPTTQGAHWHLSAIRFLKERGLLGLRDQVIIAQGGFSHKPGGTDSLEVVTVDEDMLKA